MQLTFELDEHVVFDFETTGLSPWGGDEIIEVGAMRVYGTEIDEKNIFHSLVNPKRLIPPEATRVNGITNEMVLNAPPIEEVLPRFLKFVGDAYLVAQNAKFDMGFLAKNMNRLKLKSQIEVFDTVVLSRRCFPGEKSHNLDKICMRLGIDNSGEDRHRSIGDVKLTALAFVKLKEMLGGQCPKGERWTI